MHMKPRQSRPRVSRELRGLIALDIARRRQLEVEPFGNGWRIFGRGVDLLVADLWMVDPSDLRPVKYRHEWP